MANNIHYFGIRHHGPGSAGRLVAALEQLQPEWVLIEGPADCSDLLPLLSHVQMQPPVALMAFVNEQPTCSIHYPFAEYSPEYQASAWAARHGVNQTFIDLPVSIQLAQMLESFKPAETGGSDASDVESTEHDSTDEDGATNSGFTADPIGLLAQLQGYEDGESWWNDLIEQNSDSDQAIFQQLHEVMSELRIKLEPDSASLREQQREAHMRLEISRIAKACPGPVAVVCGAWHTPALQQKVTTKADREILKTLPGKLATSKIRSTWIPWTSPRLATQSGYGAGVAAPMWYQHLWQFRDSRQVMESWLTHVARTLREQGHTVSTASVIEATRLSHALAQVRNRPAPGFEELREAVIACLCFGESLLWRKLEQKLLLGHQVGVIPDDAPLAPLLEDLQKQQKKLQLKPEALARELALDLRSQAGAGKSILLHRLNILNVPWGNLIDPGHSRGTFRERWNLTWQPEFAVQLVENLVYGTTIEQAANNRISEALNQESYLLRLAETIMASLEAQLLQAADAGLNRFNERAAHTSNCLELLEAIPTLVSVNRYGTSRDVSLAHIAELIERLVTQAIIALPYACRNLNDEEAARYRNSLHQAYDAIQLHQLDTELMSRWWLALHAILDSTQSSLQVAGLCARLLYQTDQLTAAELTTHFHRMISPAMTAIDAARFFEGFFEHAVQRLLYDQVLLQAVESWMISLDKGEFTEHLPLLRRLFADLDSMERKRMIDTILHGFDQNAHTLKINQQLIPVWNQQLCRLEKLLQGDAAWSTLQNPQ